VIEAGASIGKPTVGSSPVMKTVSLPIAGPVEPEAVYLLPAATPSWHDIRIPITVAASTVFTLVQVPVPVGLPGAVVLATVPTQMPRAPFFAMFAVDTVGRGVVVPLALAGPSSPRVACDQQA